jgi:hypothetical protein
MLQWNTRLFLVLALALVLVAYLGFAGVEGLGDFQFGW